MLGIAILVVFFLSQARIFVSLIRFTVSCFQTLKLQTMFDQPFSRIRCKFLIHDTQSAPSLRRDVEGMHIFGVVISTVETGKETLKFFVEVSGLWRRSFPSRLSWNDSFCE